MKSYFPPIAAALITLVFWYASGLSHQQAVLLYFIIIVWFAVLKLESSK